MAPSGFHLLDNRNVTQQYRTPRRAPCSGVAATHTVESLMDLVGIDTGAENTAGFIVGRSDYGSYHDLFDSDSRVPMAPHVTHETWHVAADLHNWHATGFSAACSAHQLDPDHWWTQQTLTAMGHAIADFWIDELGLIHVARNARYGTRAEALARIPNVYHHGVLQPADRSDMCVAHPRRRELEAIVVDAIHDRANGASPLPIPTPTEEEEIDMATKDIIAKVEESTAAIIATTNRNDTESRMMEGYCCLKLADGTAQYVILPKPGVGWARLHVPGEVKSLLKRQNVIQAGAQDLADPDGDGTAELVDYVTLTAEQSADLLALPEF